MRKLRGCCFKFAVDKSKGMVSNSRSDHLVKSQICLVSTHADPSWMCELGDVCSIALKYIQRYGLPICLRSDCKAGSRQSWRRPKKPILVPTPEPRLASKRRSRQTCGRMVMMMMMIMMMTRTAPVGPSPPSVFLYTSNLQTGRPIWHPH